MDRPNLSENSPSWNAFVWITFSISQIAILLGIYNLPTDLWIKGYMAMGLLFSTLAHLSLWQKLLATLNHEARKLINRVSEVKTERMLQDYELKSRLLKNRFAIRSHHDGKLSLNLIYS